MESILFWLYGFEPSVFSNYFISFFVLAPNQLFTLSLFSFVHFILGMLGLFYLFFTLEMYSEPSLMSGVGFLQKMVNGFKLLIIFANDFGFHV